MAKNRNLIANTFHNFKLRKRSSLFIGTYIILGSFFIKYTLSEFITDSSPFGFLTVNYLEDFIFLISIVFVILSILSLFYSNRKYCRKIGNKIWNSKSKKMMWLFFVIILLLYLSLFTLLRNGLENFMIPTFIIGYGIAIILLNFSKTIHLYYFVIATILIGFIPLFISNTNFTSLYMLGITHYLYAYFYKKLNDVPIQ